LSAFGGETFRSSARFVWGEFPMDPATICLELLSGVSQGEEDFLTPRGHGVNRREIQITMTERKKPIVLLVEDSDDDAFLFKWTLRKSGLDCGVDHVVDGKVAIEYLKKASTSESSAFPHTIFLDLKMPVLNGFEVLKWLRTQTFSSPVHVLVLSGSEQQADKERAFQLGAEEYLVKPVTVEDLQRVLGHVCGATTDAGVSA
jgi:CheY-like chemotaxis protein